MTVKAAIAVFALESVAVHFTVVLPILKRLPDLGNLRMQMAVQYGQAAPAERQGTLAQETFPHTRTA